MNNFVQIHRGRPLFILFVCFLVSFILLWLPLFTTTLATMRATPFWALNAALLHAPASVLVQAMAIETSATPTTTSTSTVPSCTASTIAKICDYPSPGPEFAAASNGEAFCWQYCNDNPPCAFGMFYLGNPYTGGGSCWLYPGETYDESKADTDCPHPAVAVFDQPVCADGGNSTTATGTTGTTGTTACTATETPSAIASVCVYPTPPGDCWDGCYASKDAVQCLSLCAEAESCSYAVFNPGNPSLSPYADGSCWVYPEGEYDAGSAGTCDDAPEQYVYENKCPKPPSPSPTASLAPDAAAGVSTTSSSDSFAPTGFAISHPLAVGVAALVWQGL